MKRSVRKRKTEKDRQREREREREREERERKKRKLTFVGYAWDAAEAKFVTTSLSSNTLLLAPLDQRKPCEAFSTALK